MSSEHPCCPTSGTRPCKRVRFLDETSQMYFDFVQEAIPSAGAGGEQAAIELAEQHAWGSQPPFYSASCTQRVHRVEARTVGGEETSAEPSQCNPSAPGLPTSGSPPATQDGWPRLSRSSHQLPSHLDLGDPYLPPAPTLLLAPSSPPRASQGGNIPPPSTPTDVQVHTRAVASFSSNPRRPKAYVSTQSLHHPAQPPLCGPARARPTAVEAARADHPEALLLAPGAQTAVARGAFPNNTAQRPMDGWPRGSKHPGPTRGPSDSQPRQAAMGPCPPEDPRPSQMHSSCSPSGWQCGGSQPATLAGSALRVALLRVVAQLEQLPGGSGASPERHSGPALAGLATADCRDGLGWPSGGGGLPRGSGASETVGASHAQHGTPKMPAGSSWDSHQCGGGGAQESSGSPAALQAVVRRASAPREGRSSKPQRDRQRLPRPADGLGKRLAAGEKRWTAVAASGPGQALAASLREVDWLLPAPPGNKASTSVQPVGRSDAAAAAAPRAGGGGGGGILLQPAPVRGVGALAQAGQPVLVLAPAPLRIAIRHSRGSADDLLHEQAESEGRFDVQ